MKRDTAETRKYKNGTVGEGTVRTNVILKALFFSIPKLNLNEFTLNVNELNILKTPIRAKRSPDKTLHLVSDVG